MLRVYVAYQPFVLADALTTVLDGLEGVQVLSEPPAPGEEADVIIFRLAETGQLQNFFNGCPLPQAKLIVCSPRGDLAFIRERGESGWRQVQPFGLAEMLGEVRAAA